MRHRRVPFLALLGCLLLFQRMLWGGPPFDVQTKLDKAKKLNEQGEKKYESGNYAEALPLFQQALMIRKEALGPRHPDVAKSLNELAKLYWTMGQYVKAEPLYQKALAIRKEALGPRHPDVAKSLNNLALLYDETGQYAKAEPLYQEALAILKKALGPRHPDVATSLNNLAILYYDKGQFAKAEPLYQEALAIQKKALGPRHPGVAMSLSSLALLYTNMGQFAKAESLYQEALAIQKKALRPRHPNVAMSLYNLAILYRTMGLHSKAEPLYQEALAIQKEALGPRHPDVALSLNSLALLSIDLGQFAKAEPLLKEALAIQRETMRHHHPSVAISLNNLADLYAYIGEYAKAEPLYQEALAIQKEVLGSRHPNVATSLNNLANLYSYMGLYVKAGPLFQQALAMRKETLGHWHPDVASSVHDLALFHLAIGQLQAAIPLLKQSIDISEQFLSTVLTESRLAFLLQRLPDTEEVIYSLVAQDNSVPAVQRLALSVALLRKGRLAEEGLQTQRAIQQVLRDPWDRSLFDRLTSVRSQIASLYLKDPSNVPNYQKTVGLLESEVDGLEQKLARHSASFRTLHLPGPEEVVARAAKALPQDAALVEWLAFKTRNFSARGKEPRWGSMRYLSLVLFSDQRIRVVDLGEDRPIDEAIQAFQDRLSQQRLDYLPAAQKLHRLIMAPLQQALAGRTNLFIAPDGPLNLVPFDALHDGRAYLVDTYRLTYLTSGRDLLRKAEPVPTRDLTLTAFADPDFRAGMSSRSASAPPVMEVSRSTFLDKLHDVPPLPGTRQEAEELKRLWPQTRLFLGKDATEEALRKMKAPGILHIATHGVFLGDPSPPAPEQGRDIKVVEVPAKVSVNPLSRSALLLAGVEGLAKPEATGEEERDGLVTALEVSGMNLWGTQLVVLSACDSGRGAVQIGQGVYGLRRAFFNAGAETLVTSLWKVSDSVTRDLMISYYKHLRHGEGRVEAMRLAALAVRAQHPHPYYWAPFIVLGRGDPLRVAVPHPVPPGRDLPYTKP